MLKCENLPRTNSTNLALSKILAKRAHPWCGVLLVTILILSFVTNHWIQQKSFRRKRTLGADGGARPPLVTRSALDVPRPPDPVLRPLKQQAVPPSRVTRVHRSLNWTVNVVHFHIRVCLPNVTVRPHAPMCVRAWCTWIIFQVDHYKHWLT